MSDEDKDQCVNEMSEAATNPTVEQLIEQFNDLDRQITNFEQRYSMSSDEMRAKLRSGEISETMDHCSWLTLLRIRGRYENKALDMLTALNQEMGFYDMPGNEP